MTSSRWYEPGRKPQVKVHTREVSENGLENHNTSDLGTLDGLRGCAVAGRVGSPLGQTG